MGAERRVLLSTEAEADLGQTVDWYAKQRRGLGDRFLRSVDTALRSLSSAVGSHGSLAPGVPERLRVRRLRLRDFPYFVIFREMGDEIQVVAFAHERRKPFYWRRRVE